MNAAADSNLPAPPRAMATPHPTHKFRLLLRREFWEHKGGFLWAPLVAGAISLLLTIMAIVIGEVAARKALADGEFDGDVMINGLDLGYLTEKLGPSELHELSQGIDIALYMASGWPLIVLGFVVFFYCLGALYDERKDRSVLFWKSLPLSDRDTVLSKVASALLVAPALAIGAALVTMFGFLLVLSAMVLLHGGNPFEMVWGPGSPLKVTGQLIAVIPVYALWALPAAGWKAPATGKSTEVVYPPRWTVPSRSSATPDPIAHELPPSGVDSSSLPAGSNFATTASCPRSGARWFRNGKSPDCV